MFGIGASKSKQESQSTSNSLAYGTSNSTSGSVSGGSSLGGSTSRQDIFAEDIFADLYKDAYGAAGGIDPSVLTGQANTLFNSGTNFLSTLRGGPETDYLQSRVDGSSPVLQEQIGALGEDLGSFFRDELNPAITSKHVAGGTLGGGRQGVAQGKAMDTVGREFTRGVTDLRARDIAARDAAAGTLGQQRVAAAGTGLSAIPGLGGVAEMGAGATLDPYARLLQVMGGPMATTSSDSFSTSEDFARAFSEAMSQDFATSTSQSTSKGKSSSFNFGFSGA